MGCGLNNSVSARFRPFPRGALSVHGLGTELRLVLVLVGVVARLAGGLGAREVALLGGGGTVRRNLVPSPARIGRERRCLVERLGERGSVLGGGGGAHVRAHPLLERARVLLGSARGGVCRGDTGGGAERSRADHETGESSQPPIRSQVCFHAQASLWGILGTTGD